MAASSQATSILRQLLMATNPSRHGLDIYFDPEIVLRDLNFPYPHPMHIVTTGDDDSSFKYKVMFNVRHFTTYQIQITIHHRTVQISCNHPATVDAHGEINRSFQRRFEIPDDIDASKVTAELSQNGILTLKAPSSSPESPTGASRTISLMMQTPISSNATIQFQDMARSIPIPIQHTESGSSEPVPTLGQSLPIQTVDSSAVSIPVEPAASEDVPIEDSNTPASPQRMEE